MDSKMRNWMKALAPLATLWVLGLGAQAPVGRTVVQPPSKYQPSELQLLRLQLKQKDAQLAQKDFFIAQQNFNASLKSLNDEAAKVKTENGWPGGVGFNAENLAFTEAPAPKEKQ
jgi:hypothetical protein